MDTLDIRIYRELVHGKPQFPLETDVRKSYRAVAKALHIDEDTVRNRVARMRRSGILAGWYVLPNPNLLGLTICQIWIDLPPGARKQDAIAKLKLIPSVLTIHDCYGGALFAYLMDLGGPALKRQVSLVSGILQPRELRIGEMDWPPCSISLNATDWRIVRSIQRHPRKSYAALSKDLRISARTVRRRLSQMIAAGAIFLVPLIRPTRLRGNVLADLTVFYEGTGKDRTVQMVVSRVDESLLGVEAYANNASFHLLLNNVSGMEETVRWAGSMAGVTHARLDIVMDRLELLDHVDGQLERALAAAQTRKPTK